jgi:tryptophan synthase beta chain
MAKKMGKTRITAETGAGQHGVATATVCALMDMRCEIFMGKDRRERQHTNVERMKMLGATCPPVTTGNMTLSDACSEAIRDWCCTRRRRFTSWGLRWDHTLPDIVARMQSVISEEINGSSTRRSVVTTRIISSPAWAEAQRRRDIYHYVADDRVRIVLAEAAGHGIDTTTRQRPSIVVRKVSYMVPARW